MLLFIKQSTNRECVCSHEQTSSKNCWVLCRMCLSSVSSRKFFFRASWLVLISFSSFSSFSNVACRVWGITVTYSVKAKTRCRIFECRENHMCYRWNVCLNEEDLCQPPGRSCLWEKELLDSLQCPPSGCSPSWSPSQQTLFDQKFCYVQRKNDFAYTKNSSGGIWS